MPQAVALGEKSQQACGFTPKDRQDVVPASSP
jgi:hypothetical protein